MTAILVLSLAVYFAGGIVMNNTDEVKVIPVHENLYENWNSPNGSYFTFKKDKNGQVTVKHVSPKDFDKVLAFYKKSYESGRINKILEMSCFADGKESINYVDFHPDEIDVLRNFNVGMQKKVLFERKDSLINNYYVREYKEVDAKFKKVESESCDFVLDREFKMRDFFLLRPSRDRYSITSERYR